MQENVNGCTEMKPLLTKNDLLRQARDIFGVIGLCKGDFTARKQTSAIPVKQKRKFTNGRWQQTCTENIN